MSEIQEQYISLLKKSLLNQLYLDNELRIQYLLECIFSDHEFELSTFLNIIEKRQKRAEQLKKWRRIGWASNDALDRIAYSRTMLGEERLDNIKMCIKDVIENRVPGDLIECGVWRGGGVIFMKGVLTAFNDQQRNVWVADSFQGVPKPTIEEDMNLDLSRDTCPHLAITRQQVEASFRDYALLDERVRFIEGWFKDTLPFAPIARLALLRVDGDLYESTMDVLTALYDRVSSGGYVIVDDYFVPGCRKAVTDFRKQNQIENEIIEIDWTGIYWQKS